LVFSALHHGLSVFQYKVENLESTKIHPMNTSKLTATEGSFYKVAPTLHLREKFAPSQYWFSSVGAYVGAKLASRPFKKLSLEVPSCYI
jgi:hypothetical protein